MRGSLGRHEKIRVYPPMRKSVSFKDFHNRRGEFSKCLATEHRLNQGCEATRSATSKRLSINLVKYEKIHVLPTAKKIG